MDDKMFSHMTNLFNIAYYIAKNEKSFADFRDLLSLASKLNVEILKQYGNEIECRQFIHFIGKTIINDIVDKMKTSMFIGILIDGSTDRTSDEHAIVYARYIDNGIIKEDFLGVVDLDSACAASYFSALTDLLNKHFKKESYENKVYIAGLGTDGAASMIGCHNGLTEKMKEVCPQLITVHCVAHRLQLAVLDVCHSVEYLQTFDKILRTTFKFYNGSAKRLHNLKEAAIVLGEDIRKLGDVSNVRWLASRANALKALVYSWKAIVTQLEQSVVNKDSDSAKAKGMLQSLKTFKFVQVLHFLLDVFGKMKALSLCFQDKELMISSLKEKIKYTIKALEDLKEQKGDYEITFANDVSSTGVYKDVQLLNVQLGENSFKALRQNVIESAKNYLDERLTSVSTDIVSSFHIFDSATWPTKDKILQFGNEEIKMLALHISDQKCNEEKINFLTAEWCEYKFLFSNVTFTEALLKMQAHKARFPNLYELISFCAVIPVTTASCERGFSCYNRIKTAYRNALKTATMNDLLVCSVTGPSLNEFDPNKAIDLWYFSAKRQRYV